MPLTRQFALEYSALFDGLLPALERLGLPIPLGGSSNHFRMSALRWVAAWDAFNVTEDADLGMRLARRGYLCRTIDSTTWEEATVRLRDWIGQRTRWLKGFMQTYAVHMRHPVRLARELGPGGFIGFQVVIGAVVLAALAHPWFMLLLTADVAAQRLLEMPGSLLGLHLWLLALFNAALGYSAAMALALLAARRRHMRLSAHVLFMPAYWLLISLAAYRAVWQFARAPFRWEKTEHGLSRLAPPRPTPPAAPRLEAAQAATGGHRRIPTVGEPGA